MPITEGIDLERRREADELIVMMRSRDKLVRAFNPLTPVRGVEEARELAPLSVALSAEGIRGRAQLLPVADGEPRDLPALEMRHQLQQLAFEDGLGPRLDVAPGLYPSWQSIEEAIEDRDDDDDLLILPWREDMRFADVSIADILNDPPCNVAVVEPVVAPRDIRRILLPVRGGPYANLGLHLALRLARAVQAEITLLAVLPTVDDAKSRLLREKFIGLSAAFPEITRELQEVGDVSAVLERELDNHQAVIMGASNTAGGPPIGLVAQLILQRRVITALVVKTKEPYRIPASLRRRGARPAPASR